MADDTREESQKSRVEPEAGQEAKDEPSHSLSEARWQPFDVDTEWQPQARWKVVESKRKGSTRGKPNKVREFPPSLLITEHDHPTRWDTERQQSVQQLFSTSTNAFVHEWGGIRVQFASVEEAAKALETVDKVAVARNLDSRPR